MGTGRALCVMHQVTGLRNIIHAYSFAVTSESVQHRLEGRGEKCQPKGQTQPF